MNRPTNRSYILLTLGCLGCMCLPTLRGRCPHRLLGLRVSSVLNSSDLLGLGHGHLLLLRHGHLLRLRHRHGRGGGE